MAGSVTRGHALMVPSAATPVHTDTGLADSADRHSEESRASVASARAVLGPYDATSHLRRFTQPAVTTSTHELTGPQGSVTWRSLDAPGATIANYAYTGSDVPRTGDERVGGAAPSDGQPAEVVVTSFAFVP